MPPHQKPARKVPLEPSLLRPPPPASLSPSPSSAAFPSPSPSRSPSASPFPFPTTVRTVPVSFTQPLQGL
ncbi:unnamed protein product [Closterium sp. NIES-54]